MTSLNRAMFTAIFANNLQNIFSIHCLLYRSGILRENGELIFKLLGYTLQGKTVTKILNVFKPQKCYYLTLMLGVKMVTKPNCFLAFSRVGVIFEAPMKQWLFQIKLYQQHRLEI